MPSLRVLRAAAVTAVLGTAFLCGSTVSAAAAPATAHHDTTELMRVLHATEGNNRRIADLVTRYDAASTRRDDATKRIAFLEATRQRVRSQMNGIQLEVVHRAVMMYEGAAAGSTFGAFDASGARVATESERQTLSRLNTSKRNLRWGRFALTRERKKLGDEMRFIAAALRGLELSNAMYAVRLAEIDDRVATSVPWDRVPFSQGAGAAVAYATAQLDKPYRHAGMGPDAYDCSGLTMMAWAQAGVSMPHNSRSQGEMFARVPDSGMQPGDLVIYYRDHHHVGMYVGGGMTISATKTGDVIRLQPVFRAGFQFAVRPAVRVR
jgi:cell wall-associated NlpC family hydrolase